MKCQHCIKKAVWCVVINYLDMYLCSYHYEEHRINRIKERRTEVKTAQVEQIVESWVNGNISWVKKEIMKMDQTDFLYFVKVCIDQNIDLDRINKLLI